jgi:hypothetical protein
MGIMSDVVEVSGPSTGTANVEIAHETVEVSAVEGRPSNSAKVERVSSRIDELNQKCTQVLIFLSFAIVAVALSSQSPLLENASLLDKALMRWTVAMFPTVLGILPLKDFCEDRLRWYSFVRWLKVVLLWLAVPCVFWGAIDFIRSF